jgi:iron complex transport system substrate-binding protein
MKAKRIVILLLACMLLIAVLAPIVAAESDTVTFVDSAGREVEVPKNIESVAPSGPLAQIVLFTAVPEKLAGVAIQFREDQLKYFPEAYHELPEFGQFYGGTGTLNMETLLTYRPDVIIDIGEAKDSVVQDMDLLQAQLEIPTVFIEATLTGLPQTFEKLAELFNDPEGLTKQREAIEAAIETAARIRETLADEDVVSVYWAMGENGLNTNAAGSFHEEVLQLVGVKNAVDIEPASRNGGSEVSFEQLLIWQPEFILFDTAQLQDELLDDAAWQSLQAVRDGAFAVVPSEPYGVLANPPSINRILGLYWLGQTIYPEYYELDLAETFKAFYELFYHAELSDEDVETILGGSADLVQGEQH